MSWVQSSPKWQWAEHSARPEELLQDLGLVKKIKELELEYDKASAFGLSFM